MNNMKRIIMAKFPESDSFDIIDEAIISPNKAITLKYELSDIMDETMDSDQDELINMIPIQLYETLSAKLNNSQESMRDMDNVYYINISDANEYIIDTINDQIINKLGDTPEIRKNLSELLKGNHVPEDEYLDIIFQENCEPINTEINEIMNIVSDFDDSVDPSDVVVFYYF